MHDSLLPPFSLLRVCRRREYCEPSAVSQSPSVAMGYECHMISQQQGTCWRCRTGSRLATTLCYCRRRERGSLQQLLHKGEGESWGGGGEWERELDIHMYVRYLDGMYIYSMCNCIIQIPSCLFVLRQLLPCVVVVCCVCELLVILVH